jgi:hypothetical protein
MSNKLPRVGAEGVGNTVMPNKTVAGHIVIIADKINSGMNRERSVIEDSPFPSWLKNPSDVILLFELIRCLGIFPQFLPVFHHLQLNRPLPEIIQVERLPPVALVC